MAIIETQDLTKVYGEGPAAVTALNSVTTSVDLGEFVAVMGPSGCGKSTLLHLMGGLDRATSGSVLLDGRDLDTLDDTKLTELRRHRIGFIFQFFNLIPVLTAAENVALPLILGGVGAADARRRAADWLGKVSLGDKLDNRPDELSGGEQQRVAVARALATEPALILADEPTGNLDTAASDEIAGLLGQAVAEWGHTVVMVTHDPQVAGHARRVVSLNDGAIAGERVAAEDAATPRTEGTLD